MEIKNREFQHYLKAVDILRDQENKNRLTDSVDSLCELIPFNQLIVFNVNIDGGSSKVDNVLNFGFNKEFISEYEKRQYINIDPIFNFCLNYNTPCTWKYVLSSINDINNFDSLLNLGQKYGYRDGVSCVLKSLGQNYCTYISITTDENATENQLSIMSSLMPLIVSALQYQLNKQQPVDIKPLTSREKEVFKLIIEGKTQREISNILCITERTVNFHVANVTQKLGASNCTHAVAKILQSNNYFTR